MAATVKLTPAETAELITALTDEIGAIHVVAALTETLGIEKAETLIKTRAGKITKKETAALAMNILAKMPQATTRDKVVRALEVAHKVFPDSSRFAEVVEYVIAKVREYLSAIESTTPGPVSKVPAWSACTKASCWNGSNAQQRMMNILSPAFTDAKFAQYRDWMLSIGCNTAHVFLSNKADGEGGGYCVYGASWSWKVDAATVKLMRERMADLRAHGLAVVVWLFADDSGVWNEVAKKDFPRYCADLQEVGLLGQASIVVAGLELNEYYSSGEVAALCAAIRKVWAGRVGTHQTSGRYDYAAHADICFYQVNPGQSPSFIKSEAARVKKATGKPLNFFELDRQPNRALCDAAFAGGAFGVGNWKG